MRKGNVVTLAVCCSIADFFNIYNSLLVTTCHALFGSCLCSIISDPVSPTSLWLPFPSPESPPPHVASHSLISSSVYLYRFSYIHSPADCLVFVCLACQNSVPVILTCLFLTIISDIGFPFSLPIQIWLLFGLIFLFWPLACLIDLQLNKPLLLHLSLSAVMLLGLILPHIHIPYHNQVLWVCEHNHNNILVSKRRLVGKTNLQRCHFLRRLYDYDWLCRYCFHIMFNQSICICIAHIHKSLFVSCWEGQFFFNSFLSFSFIHIMKCEHFTALVCSQQKQSVSGQDRTL